MPGVVRWWDGAAWTQHTQWAAPVFDAGSDLAAEERAAKWARIGLVAMAGVAVVAYLIAAIYFGREIHRLIDQLREDIRAANQNRPAINRSVGLYGPELVLDLFEVVGFAGQVLFVIWLYRAATFARRAGLPARRQPVWAWLGFIVPVVSLWFPYQVTADVLPANDPARRRVAWWWACSLAQIFTGIAIIVASYYSRPVALLLAIVLAAVPILTAIHGRAVVTASVTAHRRILTSSLRER